MKNVIKGFLYKILPILFIGLIFILGNLTYTYFFSHTKPVEFLCNGGDLCYSVLPRMQSSLYNTFLVMALFLIITIFVLFPFVYHKKISKSWIICCIFILALIGAASWIIHYISR